MNAGDKQQPQQTQQQPQQQPQQQGNAGSNTATTNRNSLQPVGQGGGGGGRGGGRGGRHNYMTLPAPVADAGDGRIVLLFDLNGVLTEKTPPRVEGKFFKRDHIVRPHIEDLLRLYPHFRIGVFSSATVRTVNTALETLYAALQHSAAQRGIDGLLLPEKYELFNLIYYRDHCQPDPYWQTREDGKDHDTIKPLSRLGLDLSRTVLVDNDDYKAADGEHENMLHVPHWEQHDEATNRDFPLMVQLILRHLKGITGDVRPHLRVIERQLRQLRAVDGPRLDAAAEQTRARALTAATAHKCCGGDAALREALAAEELVKLLPPSADAAAAAAAGAAGGDKAGEGGSGAAAASAAAAAAASGGMVLPQDPKKLLQPQMQQKMRQYALQGLRAVSADKLAYATPAARQLLQLLSHNSADGDAAPTAAAGAQQQPLPADASAEVVEGYRQHRLVLLLAAVWACNVTTPVGAFTLSEVTALLQARGWPTAHLPAAVAAMVRGGVIKVCCSAQQQQQQQQEEQGPQQEQQQQQRWVWPEPPHHWPAPGVPLFTQAAAPAAAGPQQQEQQQQQQQPAWADCLLVLPEPKVKQLMKAVGDVTRFVATASPQSVADVVSALEGGRKGRPLLRAQRWKQQEQQQTHEQQEQQQTHEQQEQQQTHEQQEQQQAAAAAAAAAGVNIGQEERVRRQALASAWSTMIKAAVRDVTAAPGVPAQRLLRFIQGLSPALQQQLLGSGGNSSVQQQLQQLQELLSQLEAAVGAVAVRISDKRQKALLGPPFGVFAANHLPVFRHAAGGAVLDAAEAVHADPAAAAALTCYAAGIVPDAKAVARSIRVLTAAAAPAPAVQTGASALAAALQAARLEQQQQLDQHVAQQGAPAQHIAVHLQKPPLAACLTLSTHLNLPAIVVQWLILCEQHQQQKSGGKQDSKRQRAAGGDGDTAAAAAAGAAGSFGNGAAAAAGDSGEDGSASKRQKRDRFKQQQQEGEAAGSDPDDPTALHLDALPRAAAAAGGGSSGGRNRDADMADADHEADLDALYDLEERRRRQLQQRHAAAAAAAAEPSAMEAATAGGGQDPAAAVTAAAAVAFEVVEDREAWAGPLSQQQQQQQQGRAAAGGTGGRLGVSASAAQAAADGADVALLLPSDDEAADGSERGEEGEGEQEQEKEGDGQGWDAEGGGGEGEEDGRGSGGGGGGDDDRGADGAAAAGGSSSGDDEGRQGGGQSEGGGGGTQRSGQEEEGGAQGRGGGAAGGSGSDRGGAGGVDNVGPAGEDAFDWDEEFDGNSSSRGSGSEDPEDGYEFEGELGSEDDSDAWDTDDEADGQLQLGITGLEQDDAADCGTAAAAAAADSGAGAAGAPVAAAAANVAAAAVAAMRQSCAAAAAAGCQEPGREPLYDSLEAALLNARRVNTAAAASAAAGGSSGSRGEQQQQPSRLHHELLQFASAAAPCAVERLYVDAALAQLQAAADKLWHYGRPEAMLFGSQATGLALPGSDLDVVLLRVPGCPQPRQTDKGFGLKAQRHVVPLLGSFANQLRRDGHASKKGLQVVKAKVPILKGSLWVDIPSSQLLGALAADNPAAAQQLSAAAAETAAAGGGEQQLLRVEVQVDISIGVADSSAAVNYLQRQVRTLPPMRPLLLAAKALLRGAGLNEVFTGGLGSYTLALLVVSHLQAEGVADPAVSAMLPEDLSSPSHQAGISEHLQQLSAAAAAAAAAATAVKAAGGSSAEQKQWDLGLLLQGFFLRFGVVFDYDAEAVSVNNGGVLTKPQQWVQEKRPFLLSVEDPAMPGRDMSSGSYGIREVKAAFSQAASTLQDLTSRHEGSVLLPGNQQQQQPAAAAGQRSGEAAAAAAAVAAPPIQAQAAAAAAAAVLAGAPAGGSGRGGGSITQPPAAATRQQRRQQQQRQQPATALEVVEDREAWAAVQADGASQSVGNNASTASVLAAAPTAGGRTGATTSISSLQAAAASWEQQLLQGLTQGLGMLGQVVDVVEALGRGASADAQRQENARQVALRGQARLAAQQSQQQQHQQEQDGGGPALVRSRRAKQAGGVMNSKARRQALRAAQQEGKPRLLRATKARKLKLNSNQHRPHKAKQATHKQQQPQQQQTQQLSKKRKADSYCLPRRGKRGRQQQGGQAQQQQQQQQQQGPRGGKAKQAGKKRPRDGGAAGGGGGRGWGF